MSQDIWSWINRAPNVYCVVLFVVSQTKRWKGNVKFLIVYGLGEGNKILFEMYVVGQTKISNSNGKFLLVYGLGDGIYIWCVKFQGEDTLWRLRTIRSKNSLHQNWPSSHHHVRGQILEDDGHWYMEFPRQPGRRHVEMVTDVGSWIRQVKSISGGVCWSNPNNLLQSYGPTWNFLVVQV